MTDELEDRLRNHLAGQAAQVRAESDPSAFVEHSAGPSRRRGVVAAGAAAITVVVAGAGILTGVNLGGATSAAKPQASAPTTGSARAGADLAPAGSGAQVPPSIVFQTPYSFLFTRVSSSGVTIRAYTTGSTTTGGCGPAVVCSPTSTLPPSPTCPPGAECARPLVTPHTSGGTTGSGLPSDPGGVVPTTSTATPSSPPSQPVGSGTTGSGTAGSGTTGSGTAGCAPLVVELSTDKAVGTGSVSVPATGTPAPSTVEVLGTGSFGTAEGAPVGWVAVWTGSGVASVQLSVGGAVVDAMPPDSGVVVLAASGNAGLAGASVVGLDQSGASVDSVPVGLAATPDAAAGCPDPVSNPPAPPTTTTTTTEPGAPTPTSTTTTTTTTTTSTTTTATGAPVPVPTDRPVAAPAG